MPYGLETDRAELGSSSRRSEILQCESGRTQVPNVESTKPHTSTYPILCFHTAAHGQGKVTKSLHQYMLHTHTRAHSKQGVAVPVSGWRESCREGGRSAAWWASALCLLPCPVHHTLWVYVVHPIAWAQGLAVPPPVHHTLRSRVSQSSALIRFGVGSPLPRASHVMGQGCASASYLSFFAHVHVGHLVLKALHDHLPLCW